MFKIGEHVIYGGMGVCTVQDICLPNVADARKCYLLTPTNFPKTKVYAPVADNPVPMREVMSESQSNQLIDSFDSLETFKEAKKNDIARLYRSILQSGNGHEIAKLVKTLQIKRQKLQKQNKKLTGQEKATLTSAERLFHGEIAQALHIELAQVPAYIQNRLSQLQETA